MYLQIYYLKCRLHDVDIGKSKSMYDCTQKNGCSFRQIYISKTRVKIAFPVCEKFIKQCPVLHGKLFSLSETWMPYLYKELK